MVEYKTIQVDIGLESSFTKLPAQVDVGDWSYFPGQEQERHVPVALQCVSARNG